MKKKYQSSILLTGLLFLLVSCKSNNYSHEVENVLTLAGNNRQELEKVLNHYSQIPDDSLKLRAAEFLIINMPGKYSEYYDASWAEICYWQASYMCPNRFVPLYNLVKLYRQMSRDVEARDLAQQILDKKVKIPSGSINNIKREMRELLDCETIKKDLPMDG